MISFAFPAAFFALALPLLVYLLLPARQRQSIALYFVHLQSLQANSRRTLTPTSQVWLKLLALILIYLSLVCAAALPQWQGDAQTLPNNGRDLLLAVDISGSMEEQDMPLNGQPARRIDVVKHILGDFVQRRVGDRIGLILFGSQAYLQAPLSFDRNTVAQLLNEAELGFAGKQTAIGDAIGLGVKRLRENANPEKVMILLTDGANTSGAVEPGQAARLAVQSGLKIYTVGIGANEMVVPGLFGSSLGARRVNPSRDLDENLLKNEIAEPTGGRYFRATNSEELAEIYQLLDELEPVEYEADSIIPIRSLFMWPLGTAMLLSLVWALLALMRGHARD